MSAAVRLLVVSTYFDTHPGGLEVVAARLARELAGLGFAVEWAATDASPAPADRELAYLSLPAWNAVERACGIPLPVLGPAALKRLDEAVARSDVVLIHDTLYQSSICAMLAARRRRKPVLILQHLGDALFMGRTLQAVVRLAERLVTRPMLARADQVVFISEAVAGHFAALTLASPPLTSFSGVDTAVFRPPANAREKARLRAGFGLDPTRPVALYVGRFVAKKGLETLRRVAALRPDLDFAFAGWGPVDPAAWGAPNVRMMGQLSGERLGDLYRAADVFTLASPSESFSLVVREAMACGLPVICGEQTAQTDSEAAAHVIAVPIDRAGAAATARGFAAAIDPALAARDGAGRIAFVRRRYDWRRVAALYAAQIERLARAEPAREPMAKVA